MKSACFFSSYFERETIPFYIKIYLEELSKYFSEMIFLTNEKNLHEDDLRYLTHKNFKLIMCKNEGYDFGMWYKAFNKFNIEGYQRIGLINDSCILYRKLDSFFHWLDSENFDYCGMIASGKISYHIQSYFTIINKPAFLIVKNYFLTTGIKHSYKEVIYDYEIGLSKHLLENGYKLGGFYDYSFEKTKNPSFLLAADLIEKKCPVIKKKILSRKYRVGDYLTWFRNDFIIDSRYYINLIKKQGENLLVDFDKLIQDPELTKSHNDIFTFAIFKKIYKTLSRFKFLRVLFHQMIYLKRKFKIEF